MQNVPLYECLKTCIKNITAYLISTTMKPG